jgi:hypothetical protein
LSSDHNLDVVIGFVMLIS